MLNQHFSLPAFSLDDRHTLLCEGAESTRICRGSHIHPRTWPVWSVTRKQIAVLFPCKVSKFIKSYKIIRLTLVFDFVFCVLHRSKNNLCSAWECPGVARRVVLCFGKRSRIIVQTLVDQFCQLRVGLSQYQSFVMRNMHLPQRFYDKSIAFSTALTSSSTVKSLLLRSCHKRRLSWLRFPYNVATHSTTPFKSFRLLPGSSLHRPCFPLPLFSQQECQGQRSFAPFSENRLG